MAAEGIPPPCFLRPASAFPCGLSLLCGPDEVPDKHQLLLLVDPERLGVPLDGAEVLLIVSSRDCLRRPVRRLCLKHEALSEFVRCLVVKGVHLEVIGAEEILKLSEEPYRMGRQIIGVCLVVLDAGALRREVIGQRSAEIDVDYLYAAADAEDRDPVRERVVEERVLEVIELL